MDNIKVAGCEHVYSCEKKERLKDNCFLCCHYYICIRKEKVTHLEYEELIATLERTQVRLARLKMEATDDKILEKI